MKKVLVIQLCRIGDILMTGPTLRGLRREYPSAEISLMVMDAFAATPLPVHLYDRLLSFPLGGLAGTLARREAGWEPALEQLKSFVRDCTSTPFDLIVNLTHTDMSALITSLLPARRRAGLVMRADRRRGIDSAWMTHMRAAVRSRDMVCFHLVDLFAWTAGVARDALGLEMDITNDDHAWAAACAWARPDGARPLIAMQLGASAESKQWPIERFAALADALDPALGDIVLIGGPQERALATAFRAAAARPVFDSIGGTTLRQLGALLQRCQLLITNDTGPMHVAAAVGTPVMDISSGPVSAHETGPYGVGHIVIEPDIACYPCPLDSECHHYACRTSLTPTDAAAVASYALGATPPPTLTGARILQSRRSRSTGRIEFVPVGTPLTVKDRVRMEAADVWERTLAAPARVGDGWAELDGRVAAVVSDPERFSAIEAHLREVAREADGAAVAVRALPAAAPAKVPTLAAGVHATLERLLALGESERAVHAIVTHLRHEIDSANAPDLPGMAKAQAVAYRATAVRARMLADALAG